MEYPAKTLVDAFNACDPVLPLKADDERYVDLSAGRGDEGRALVECKKHILSSRAPLVQLLAGHRGCGKSTELQQLRRDLEDEGYFVAYFEVDKDIDLEDTKPVDILLAYIRNLEESLREAGYELKAALLEDFLLWFGDVVLEKTKRKEIEAEVKSEIGIEAGIPLFAKLLSRFTGIARTGTESKKTLRRKLDARVSQLLQRGQLLVTDARNKVKKAGKKDLVVVLDNLDRIALKDLGPGRTTHEMLFVERGELLTGFGCHTVVTVPISLLFSPKLANLKAIFPNPYVLPMVKIAERGTRDPWAPGRELMIDMLRKRLDLDLLFEEGAVEDLISASGGHPRLLMTLVRNAVISADDPPVAKAVARKVVRRLVNDYGRSIPEEHWPLLAGVYRSQTVKNDEAHQLMLFNLSVLEYQNEDRWCDVHPAILELPQFQAELKRLSDEPSD